MAMYSCMSSLQFGLIGYLSKLHGASWATSHNWVKVMFSATQTSWTTKHVMGRCMILHCWIRLNFTALPIAKQCHLPFHTIKYCLCRHFLCRRFRYVTVVTRCAPCKALWRALFLQHNLFMKKIIRTVLEKMSNDQRYPSTTPQCQAVYWYNDLTPVLVACSGYNLVYLSSFDSTVKFYNWNTVKLYYTVVLCVVLCHKL